MKIRVVVTGRQYHAAETLPRELSLSEGSGVDAALASLAGYTPDGRLSESCLLAVSGVHLGTVGKHADQALRDGDELLLLAPVAGG
jgi:molybdopterin converting factor small subunit